MNIIRALVVMVVSQILTSCAISGAELEVSRVIMRDKKESTGRQNDIVACVEFKAVQRAVDGIALCIEVRNDSSEVVVISNPLDYLQISIESNGVRAKLPGDGVPRGILDTPVIPPRPFTVSRVQMTSDLNAVSEQPVVTADAKQVNLAANGKYRVTVIFDKVERNQPGSGQFGLPIPGIWRINLNASLLVEKHSQRLLTTGWMEMKLTE